MDDQLYLFEALIDNIYFEEAVEEVPPKKQIVVSVKLGSVITLEVRSETLPTGGEGHNKRHIDFKTGRSYLCFMSSDDLLKMLEKEPLEVNVGVRGDVQPIGSSNAPWDDSFKELVQTSKEAKELVTPAAILDNFCLLENGVIKGNVQIFLRLSCFGKSIHTQFEVLQEAGNKQFLFKTPNMGTTFICSKYGAGTSTDFIPVSALYNAGNIRTNEINEKVAPSAKSASWTAVMDQRASSMYGPRSSIVSEFLFPEYLNIKPPIKESAITFDIVSLRVRPDDEKFLDFMTGRKLGDLDENSIHTMSLLDNDGNEKVIFIADETKMASLGMEQHQSVEQKARSTKACQCPKKPTYCKHVLDAIEKYQKSHPDLMIHGRRVKYEKLLKPRKSSNEDPSDTVLRLKGGNDKDDTPPYVIKKKKGCYNPTCLMAEKLRSVGISQLTENFPDDEKTENTCFCADFYCPESTRRNVALQVTFSEEPLQFHFTCPNIHCPAAKKYKKLGLGPLAIEKCQGTLYGPVKPPVQYGLSQTYGTFDTYGPFGIFSKTDTPFLPDEGELKKKARPVLRLRGGGTSGRLDKKQSNFGTKSPIAECQEVMEQFDKILEEYRNALASSDQAGYKDLEQYMAPSTTANCGHPRCTYISEPALPPIHWDCPEPLPVGICKNPQCPYLPQDLKRISRILEAKRRSRHNECTCQREFSTHYSAPDFNSPNKVETQFESKCPFYNPPKTVNMMQYCNSFVQRICDAFEKSSDQICGNPKCPLKNMVSSCSNPECPFAHGDMRRVCSNPSCPFTQKDSTESSCSNPNCPYSQKKLTDSCSNPDCPFRQQQDISAPCSNPDCPFKHQPDISAPCSNPDCPYKQQQDISEPCSNPDCPFKQPSSEESCHNPDCPFKKKESVSSGGSCGNPDCPFKTMRDYGLFAGSCNATSECKCDNPNCPEHKETCSNPECPFNLQDVEICGNPKCPYKSRPSAKKKGICGPSEQSICGDVTCPFHEGAKGGQTEQTTTGGGGDAGKQGLDDKSAAQIGGPLVDAGALEFTKGERPSRYDMTPCTVKTCRYMGGKLECADCATLTDGKKRGPCPRICQGDIKCPLSLSVPPSITPKTVEVLEKRALKKARRQYVYHIGDKYPGMHVGHHQCVITPFIVPPKMGWLWNLHTPCLQLKPRRGWRPGAIGKTVLEAIQAHRRSQNMAPLEAGKRKRKRKFGGDESETEIVRPKPTLQIRRKEGVYYITMNPLKDPRTLVTNENPYMECTPMQFKIMKNKENNNYRTCVCNDQGIVYEPESTSSSSDSELELEFTPPAGIIRPERFIKTRDVIHIDTQYNAQDFEPPQPEKLNRDGKDKGDEKDKSKDKIKKGKKEKKKAKKEK